jgi:hypothetical protein
MLTMNASIMIAPMNGGRKSLGLGRSLACRRLIRNIPTGRRVNDMLCDLIKTTGFELVLLRQILYASYHRFTLTKDESEMTSLTREQLIMFLMVARAVPGDVMWNQVEALIGEKLSA